MLYERLPLKTIGTASVLLTCVMVYWDIFMTRRKFTNYDDPVNYEQNERVKRVSAENLRWIFFDGALVGVYEPVSNFIKMILLSNISQEWHATLIVRLSLMLHLTNVWILVRILAKMNILASNNLETKNLSFALFLATIIWSMHPLRVENVAWASCLPHMLANMFGMLCVNAHLNRIVLDSKRHFDSIWFSTIMYALSVFSKTSTIALPGFLFILSVQRYGKVCKISTVKLMLSMGFVSCIAFLQATRAKSQDYIQSGSLFDHLTPLSGITYAFSAFAFYVSKSVWPVDITTWYPIPQWVVVATTREIFFEVFSFSTVGRGVLFGIFCLMLLLVATLSKKYRNANALLVSYILLLVPTLGVISHHSSALAADRYVYLPSAFVFAPCTMSMLRRFVFPAVCFRSKWSKFILCTLFVMALSISSQGLVRDWSSSVRLWKRGTEINFDDAMPFSSLGNAYNQEIRDVEASRAYRRALELNPSVAVANHGLASVLFRQGLFEEAATFYLNAANLRSSLFLSCMINAAISYERIGRVQDAKRIYENVLKTYPTSQHALNGIFRINNI